MDALHLQELQARNIFSLSGGQKQLLAFGSVYAMGPEIFVLDEPTANLDQDAIARLHDQIAGLKRQGRTVVIAEHRLYFLTDLIDRALYLRDGVLERTFTRKQFCALTGAAASDPVTPEQAAKAILAERLCDTMFLNQIDTETQRSLADRFAAALGLSLIHI